MQTMLTLPKSLRTSAAIVICLILASLLLSGRVLAQQQPPTDPIGENVFPPELVLQHQQELGLTDQQKESLKKEMRSAQLKFTDLQFQLLDQSEKLVATLKGEKINEIDAIALLDKTLDVEREIKRLQFALVIRIKNVLTADQQERLKAIRAKASTKPGNE